MIVELQQQPGLSRDSHTASVRAIITVPSSSSSSSVLTVWSCAGDGPIVKDPSLHNQVMNNKNDDSLIMKMRRAVGAGIACSTAVKHRWAGRRAVWAELEYGSGPVYGSESASLGAEHTGMYSGRVTCIADVGSLMWTRSIDHAIRAWDNSMPEKRFTLADQGGRIL